MIDKLIKIKTYVIKYYERCYGRMYKREKYTRLFNVRSKSNFYYNIISIPTVCNVLIFKYLNGYLSA